MEKGGGRKYKHKYKQKYKHKYKHKQKHKFKYKYKSHLCSRVGNGGGGGRKYKYKYTQNTNTNTSTTTNENSNTNTNLIFVVEWVMEEGAGGNLLISAQNPHSHTLPRCSIQQILNLKIQNTCIMLISAKIPWTSTPVCPATQLQLIAVFPVSHPCSRYSLHNFGGINIGIVLFTKKYSIVLTILYFFVSGMGKAIN